MIIVNILKQGWDLFCKKKTITITNIFIAILMSLFIFSSILSYYLINQSIDIIKDKLDFSIYFKAETTKEDIEKLKNILENFPGVKEVKYITRDIAFEEFKKKAASNPAIEHALKELNINPLVDYLVVRSDDPTVYNEIANYIEQSPYRATIEFLTYYENKKAIERFISLANQIKFIVGFFMILVLVFSFLIILNSTILSIYSQKEDIEIFRLIGASNYYISMPFLVFNIINGFVGFLFSEAIFLLFLTKTSDFWNKLIFSLNPSLFFYQNFFIINLSIFGFVIIINIISSLVAIQKYLKV